MKDDPIPNCDHISRFCRPAQVEEGNVQATAFLLRPGESELSVDWLEILKCQYRENEIIKMREVYASRLTVGATAKIAILNVGEICDIVLNETPDNRHLDVLHDPEENGDDPHSSIYNLREDDNFIAELLLETVQETHRARA